MYHSTQCFEEAVKKRNNEPTTIESILKILCIENLDLVPNISIKLYFEKYRNMGPKQLKAFLVEEELKAFLDECFEENALRFLDNAPQYTMFSGRPSEIFG
jgi:hypothetical protein